jgi:biopolymer transport protein ExbD
MPLWQGGKPLAVSGPSSGGEMFWQINITPLTDIFLVLLIIFMVTTSVTIEAASHVDLPLAENTAP